MNPNMVYFRPDLKDFFYKNKALSAIGNLLFWLFMFIFFGTVMSYSYYGSTNPMIFLVLAIVSAIICEIASSVSNYSKSVPNWLQYMNDDKQKYHDRGIQMLGLDGEQINEIDPIAVSGPDLDGDAHMERMFSENKTLKKAALNWLRVIPFVYGIYLLVTLNNYRPQLILKWDFDGKVKYSLVKMSFFYFSSDQMYVYEVYYDVVSQRIYQEDTKDFFYKDIDCVQAETFLRSVGIGRSERIKQFDGFATTVYSGTIMDAISDEDETILNQVDGMRSLIREKKNQ